MKVRKRKKQFCFKIATFRDNPDVLTDVSTAAHWNRNCYSQTKMGQYSFKCSCSYSPSSL